MARDLNSRCKKCRRAGEKLFLKGERCASVKCAMIRKPYAPGVHGKRMGRGLSEYGKQLAMKQRIKRIYGVLEKQFRKHFEDISGKEGIAGNLLMIRLEMRLDNVVYRMGLASSRNAARQLVNHGLLKVNGKSLDVPSALVKIGDSIKVSETKKEKKYFKDIAGALKNKKDVPSWISMDVANLEGKIVSKPDIASIGINADPQLVVEYYSR
ncbi:MAG: 30S ribosomal protein S4 [Candidatus Moranbacteria bacterium GW2011_GWE1_35_17]|nr:MAG: 30S ribosomal protein S4 [Candidatus Moranbacteria bacterium GW2011_GWE1_35_17]KKP68735.1 MAG: 30S ribosomal protein S4 [Candidatus Moranbacteria bacterium GW2011_GWE2_35_164]KKP84431.1 MAG: 30S ribosomal protein S4 [Candidatus Moranbacteria bacterium GW2011_GWF2_35_54]HBR79464.1 30S ribosomal protein S4 [Candidatus Moranbacteria bacterium]